MVAVGEDVSLLCALSAPRVFGSVLVKTLKVKLIIAPVVSTPYDCWGYGAMTGVLFGQQYVGILG